MVDDEMSGRVITLLDVLSVNLLNVSSIVEQVQGSTQATQSTLEAHVLETRAGFSRVERRLGNIETRTETLETHVAHIGERLDSIEAHLERSDNRLDLIETTVTHIDATLAKLI